MLSQYRFLKNVHLLKEKTSRVSVRQGQCSVILIEVYKSNPSVHPSVQRTCSNSSAALFLSSASLVSAASNSPCSLATRSTFSFLSSARVCRLLRRSSCSSSWPRATSRLFSSYLSLSSWSSDRRRLVLFRSSSNSFWISCS